MSVFEVLVSFGPYRRGQVHEFVDSDMISWGALAAAGYVRELEVIPDAPAVVDHVLVGPDDPDSRVRVRRAAKKAEVTDGQDPSEPGDGPSGSQE